MTLPDAFGCPRCFQADAASAYEALRGFKELARPVDEPHFIVRFAACPHCAQRCVIVFTETIDWQDGEDPQYRRILPLSLQEADALIAQGEAIRVGEIEALGAARRHLAFSWPKNGSKTIVWANGPLFIGPHD